MNLQEIQDHLEITQVLQRYAKALDDKCFNLLHTVFTADAWLVYVIGAQRIEASMPEAEQTLFRLFLTKCYWTAHLVSALLIELQGDVAHAASRAIATSIQIRKDGSRNMWIVWGGYEDDFVRTAEGWRIRQRVTNAPCEQGVFLAEGVREFQGAPPVGSAV